MPRKSNTLQPLAETPHTPHPCTELFPPMSPEQEADFIADIKRNGLREPIIIDQCDRIVDGVHRYRACMKLGLEPKLERRNLTDKEAWALSTSRNLHRRHLSEATRAAINAEARKSANLPVTQAEAAKAFRVSERTQRSAEAVFDASPDLHRAVKNDQLSVHAAEKITKLPAAERAAAIAKVKQGDIDSAKALTKTAATPRAKISSTAKSPARTAAPAIPARKRRDAQFKINAIYAPLFAELDQLADHLDAYPLASSQAQQLVAELRKAIERIENANKE